MRTRAVGRWVVVAIATLVLLAGCSPGTTADGPATAEDPPSDDGDDPTACILERLRLEFGIELESLGGDHSPEVRRSIDIARDVCELRGDDASDAGTATDPPTRAELPDHLNSAPDRFDPADQPPGDDETLDELWRSCGEGDASACDELYFAAQPESDYAAFGFSCGGRANRGCLDLLGPPEDDPDALHPDSAPPGEDAELDQWWLLCADGSARACDQLLLTSPAESAYYAFGNSCGGRTTGYCSTLLGADGNPPVLDDITPEDPAPGEDDLLDSLWRACAARDAQACGDLYAVAPFGSAYERFAISCGGIAIEPCVIVFAGSDAPDAG